MDQSLNKGSKKSYFYCLKTIIPKTGITQTKEQNLASDDKQLFLPGKQVWFTPRNADETMPYPQYAPS